MAEGLLRSLFGDRLEALSAGAKPAGYVHPRAAAVMAEQGIDIKSQTSKSIHAFSAARRFAARCHHWSLFQCR
jgi:arsenate reductase